MAGVPPAGVGRRVLKRRIPPFPSCRFTSRAGGLYAAPMIPFLKMHGLGNDFVILDARPVPIALTPDQARRIADRRFGVGCDQIVLMEPPRSPDSLAFIRFLNADGSDSGACGNASRCVAALLGQETAATSLSFDTAAGVLRAELRADGRVTVDMGPPLLDWQQVPLASAVDTLQVPIGAGPVRDACCLSMGNPHAVFFVPDAEQIDLETIGPILERDPLFPERCNIEIASLIDSRHIRMRVWERGAGVTRACGTGACATLVAAHRRGLSGRQAAIILDGGVLDIDWRDSDGHVLMTGPVATAFTGTLSPDLLHGDRL
jgi:diaminopimelate epimerase